MITIPEPDGAHKESPLLTVAAGARILWPDLPVQQARRRLYRWLAQGTVPPEAILRAGRGLHLRRAVFLGWLDGDGPREA